MHSNPKSASVDTNKSRLPKNPKIGEKLRINIRKTVMKKFFGGENFLPKKNLFSKNRIFHFLWPFYSKIALTQKPDLRFRPNSTRILIFIIHKICKIFSSIAQSLKIR